MPKSIYPKPKKRKRGDLEVKKIPVPKGDDHPPPPNGAGIMPNHEFTMGLIGPKGVAKTTTIVNLIEIYSGYFHEIYIFSPTIKSDSKWDYVKQLKCQIENKPLKDWCRKMEQRESLNSPLQPAPIGIQFGSILEEKFSPTIPEDHFFDEYVMSKFKKIMDDNKRMVDMLKDHGKLKTLANRILFIFDDQVGSDLFYGKLKKYFTGVNTRHRHHSASMIMVSQGYKEIPKTIRTNWTCLLTYKIGNMKEIEVIYEEFEMGLNFEDWLALYRQATKEKFNFLFIDMYCDEEFKMRKNFDTALNYKEMVDNEDSAELNK